MNMTDTPCGPFGARQMARLIAGLACWMALSASAQWQWMDRDGRKVYSDRPPPSDILDKNILKRQGGLPAQPAAKPAVDGAGDDPAAAAASAGAAAQAAANMPKLSGVDKDLEQKKKQAAEAEAAKRKVEDEKLAKAKTESCARAKQGKATLDSGVRMRRTNEKGEREFIDDTVRAEEAKRMQNIIDTTCG